MHRRLLQRAAFGQRWVLFTVGGASLLICGILVVTRFSIGASDGLLPILQQNSPEDALTLEGRWRGEAKLKSISVRDDIATRRNLRSELVLPWKVLLSDPDDLVASGLEESLLDTVAKHALVRAEMTPAAYIELIEQESQHQWAPDAALRDVRNPLESVYYFHFDGPMPQEVARSLIVPVWDKLYREHAWRFASIGTSDRGARLSIAKIRSADYSSELGFTDSAEAAYWWGSAATALGVRFIVPTVGIDRIIERDRSAIIAHCQFVVECADGGVIGWYSTWFLDPATGMWSCDRMVQKFFRSAVTIF